MSKKNRTPDSYENLGELIPSLASFGERVAKGEATPEEIRFMSKVADLAAYQGDECLRRQMRDARYALAGF